MPVTQHRIIVTTALRDKSQHRPRRLGQHHAQQLGAVQGNEQIIGADVEGTVQVDQVDIVAAAEYLPGLLYQPMHLFAQGQRTRRRHQATAGAYQDRVAQGITDTPQGPAHRCRAQVHALRRAHHAALVEQGIEGDEQVHVRELHGRFPLQLWETRW
ncbi:hypothetical protein GLGCALEP_05519 [Pseudomonas sp. MM221]|nr:hypothetical protein DBADOPDK_05392 [Pseudomonas sp. MM223]CAI3809473.1 hypothetical protein GLGCALEP_05519 [Pseudomonas sp. MM221]